MTSSPLTLAALLAHPGNGGLRLVAGPGSGEWHSLDVEVTADALAPRADAVRGSLAILIDAFPDEPWRQDAMIRRLGERGCAAVAVPGASRAGTGARRLADRFGVALLEAERPFELARACWQLLQSRDALTLDYVRRVAQAFEYPAADLGDLLAHLASATGHGIALVDVRGTVQEAGGALSAELHAGIDFSPWMSLVRAGGSAAAAVRVDSSTRSGLRLAIFDDGLSESQLLALSVVAEIMMPAVAARILIDELEAVNDASASADLLRDFLELRGARDPEVQQRMLERGWRTSGYHLGFQVVPRVRTDPIELLRAVSQELSGVSIDAHATLNGQNVIGWMTLAEPPTAPLLEQATGALHEMHLRLRGARDVATGIGSLQDGETGLSATLGEASDAARIAAGRSSSGYFVRVDALGLEQLLLAWTGNDTFLPAAESLLAPLRDEPSALLETLAVFLDQESGVQATAAALGLHRNTVSQRIQRAQELLSADFSSPETRLALHLACRTVLEQER